MRSLILGARSGDLDAYGEIVRRFQDMAYGYAYSVLGDFHLAEDAAQEAFIEAYGNLAKLRRPEAFPGWFRKVVFKHCDRLLRRRRVHATSLAQGQPILSADPGPVETVLGREMRDAVLAAIRSLPDDERTVTTLFYINGYSQTDIADFLGVPASTVNNRLHASRKRLKERMIRMVAQELKDSALPDDFTAQTVERVVAEARELNRQRKWAEAERLLRELLPKAPGHGELLKQLNCALLHGRIWGERRYALLPETVAHGRELLASDPGDDALYEQVCDTLLYIPDMPSAIEFLQAWIAKRGPTVPSLTRLAWARACVGQYDAAEAAYKELMALAGQLDRTQAERHVRLACRKLVDCLSVAGETSRAQRIETAGWRFARDLRPGPAGLASAAADIAREWLSALRHAPKDAPDAEDAILFARLWADAPEAVVTDWLAWFRRRLDEPGLESRALQKAVALMILALEDIGGLDERRRLLLGAADMLSRSSDEALVSLGRWCRGTASAAEVYIEAGDLDTAEKMAREGAEVYHKDEIEWLYEIAILRGEPSPPELMKQIAEKGVEAAPHGAWYHVAREAAAAGDERKAFQALRRACEECWWVKPTVRLRMWENDARWGRLREHPEFKRIIAEKRRRVGVAYGEIQFAPHW